MKIEVPTSWNDVSVNQFQALTEIKRESYKSDLAHTCAIIQVLCNLDNTTNLPLYVVNEISPLISFLGTELKHKRIKDVEYNGKEYEWLKSFDSITVGEIISIELPIELEELTHVLSYDVVLAVMLREKGSKFDSDKFKENRELFGGLPITEVLGNILFFLSGGKDYSNHSKDYLVVPKITTTLRWRRWRRWKRLLKRKSNQINGSV
tara:strand:+ start:167 stop:787 length:621 start_codon:yes stop_codon:yes gene_type:complete